MVDRQVWRRGLLLLLLAQGLRANDALLGQEVPGGLADPELAVRGGTPGITVTPNRSESDKLEAARRERREAAELARQRLQSESERLAEIDGLIRDLVARLQEADARAEALAVELGQEEEKATRAEAEAEQAAMLETELLERVRTLEAEFQAFLERRKTFANVTQQPGAAEAEALRKRVDDTRARLADARDRQQLHSRKAAEARQSLVAIQRDRVRIETLSREFEARREAVRQAVARANSEALGHDLAAAWAGWNAWWSRRFEEAEAVIVDVEVQTRSFVLRNRPF